MLQEPGALRDESGQATVEYLIVGVVLIIVIVGVAALWRFVSGGGLAALMASQPSHALGSLGGAADVLMY